jgi:hypothetical protein
MTGGLMNDRSQARIVRFALLAALIATISLVGGIVTAFAADFAHAAGATPELQRVLVIGSAALSAFTGVQITARHWRL